MLTVSWVNFGLSVLQNAIQGHGCSVQAAGDPCAFTPVLGGPPLPPHLPEGEFAEQFP